MSEISQSKQTRLSHKQESKWYSLTKEALFEKLQTGKEGLSSSTVEKRLEKFGDNKIPESKNVQNNFIYKTI